MRMKIDKMSFSTFLKICVDIQMTFYIKSVENQSLYMYMHVYHH